MQDERERLRAAGFSEAEIDAELGPKRPQVRVAAESSAMQGPGKAPARAAQDAEYLKGLGRQFGQGVFGLGDEAEGAVRSIIEGRPYRDVRDEARAGAQQFANDNPKMAIAANLAGGVATGVGLGKLATKIPAIAKVGLAPSRPDAAATTIQRLGQAAKIGGATGAATGAGMAPEAEDMWKYAVGGGVGGAALGTLFSAGADAIRNARNAVATTGVNGQQLGPIRRRIAAESPEQMGVRRILNAAARGGQNTDELLAASRAAPESKALFEVIPENQGTRLERIARNVGRNRDGIDRSLAERTAETPARYSQVISDITGVPEGLDAKIVGEKAFAAVEPRYEKLMQKAYSQPDAPAAPLVKVVEKLAQLKRGKDALTRAGELSTGFDALQVLDPANPVISVQNAHNLRQGLDYAIERAIAENDGQMVKVLTQQRSVVDRFVKKAGGKAMQRADRLWESAAAEGESFALGQQSQLAKTKPRMVQMKLSAKDPQAFQRGAASRQIEGVEAISDGVAGQTRNPTVATMGNKTARARSSLGYETPGDFRRARGAAEDIVSEIASQRAVSGNSTTAANLAEMADEFMADPAMLIQAPLNPVGTLRLMGERGGRLLQSGLNAEQATQMGRVLSAGLPGQMSRREAEAMIERIAPFIQRQMFNQLVTRGTLTGATVRGLSQPAR